MVSVLVVCTGNVCRSPMAEGFIRHHLRRRGVDARVSSAGTSGWEGSEAMADSIEAARYHGVDIAAHRARRLTGEMVDRADLVVAMAAEHRDLMLDAVPEAADRTFTLKELVRLLESLPRGDGPDAVEEGDPDEVIRARVAGAARLREEDFPGEPGAEDVADPLGLSGEFYRAIAWELDDLCSRLAESLAGPVRASAAPRGQDR